MLIEKRILSHCDRLSMKELDLADEADYLRS